jgi:hypothetical protein
MGLLGAQYIFVHWVTSDGEPISNTIVMDGPKTVIPLYVFSFPETTLLGVIFTSMVVVIVAIVLARKRLS